MSGLDAIVHRRDLTTWNRFVSSPLLFLARWLYLSDATLHTNTPYPQHIRLVCISDTHNTHSSQPPLPEGDILIHAGDLTQSGTDHELDDALAWLNSQPHLHKLFIAGNHDVALVSPETRARISPGLTYLEDSSVELTISGRKLLIYGSPYTPKHGSWPFQYPRVYPPPTTLPQPEAHEIWSNIPPLADVLITHGPPFGHLDADRFGCYALLYALWRVHPQLHVFGHIHAGRGVERIKWDKAQMVYEDICARRAAWGGLVKLLWYKLTARLWRRFLGADVGTLLVNAAAVSGLRDDQMKGAIVVEI
ncbi:metallophosphoesterase domain-containing protein 1 [Cantharellus anzutake]|uniref:metallophosphoesterase domain-containing protein 1 n=1 Tax=Cantharellus anzutake TaxID=1750568 RepID=UPI001908091E|nr:metallophosphoesterase domain-containing protein 1 [Cantharellus anzutake]KAF8335368.1 metallophosphoesterase domain-containing protein 1 [Cantharellus anzutake]